MTAVVVDRQHPVEAAMAAARAASAEAADGSLWSLADDQLAGLVAEAGAVVAAAQAVLLRLVEEADAREALVADGAASSEGWLRGRLRLSPAEAASYVRTARGLRSGLHSTARACRDGRIGLAHAAVITRTVADLPADPALRRDAERDLVEAAGRFDPVLLSRLGRRLLAVADPDRVDAREGDALARAEERAARRMDLSLSPDGEDGCWLRGRLDAEGSATLRAALDPLAAPRPAAADGPDPRSPGRRRAEALVQLARRAVAAGDLPAAGGEPPQVVVTVPLQVLRTGVGAGMLDDGNPISATTARRLACDARIIPAVLGGRGEPLDLGRARRLFTGPLRRALVLRDRGCAFPGCDRPPGWCDAHHIRPWATGGPTTLTNGVLLCRHHHRLAETGDWQITLTPDGIPQFHPHPGSIPTNDPCATASTSHPAPSRKQEPMGSCLPPRRQG
ncbi:MAG: DUF222 domain-containing protein [Mycobacteriales bacterium]